MEEPPDQYRRRNNQQPKHLVAPKRTPLNIAPLVFGNLLLVRLDPAFNHRCAPNANYRLV